MRPIFRPSMRTKFNHGHCANRAEQFSHSGELDTAESQSTSSSSEKEPLLRGRRRPAAVVEEEDGADGSGAQRSDTSAGGIRLHTLSGDDESNSDRDVLTPIDGKSPSTHDTSPQRRRDPNMAASVSVGWSDDDGEGPPLPENGQPKKQPQTAGLFAAIGNSQAGVVELSSLITNPGMKRTESSDVLNLTLHQTARDGDADNMRRLLQSLTGNVKKKVNMHDDEQLSALHYAARYNHHHICKLLVDFGANVNDTDDDGATPLHFAARYKRMRLLTKDQMQEPEVKEMMSPFLPYMPTPMGIKTDEGEEIQTMPDSSVDNSVILYLVSSKAKVNQRDNYGCTPLHFAAMRGNEVATKELLSCTGINVEEVDKQQMSSLHMAASHDEAEVVRMLIEAGANLRCCDEDDTTPLHYACSEGNSKVADMLFEAGEKQDGWVTVSQMVTAQDCQQNTPLHLAVENRGHDVAKMCIEKGADVNASRNNYSTPLHLAAVAGDIQIVQLLLDHNARIDALDLNQCTPLHKAAAYNHADVVEFLLERGAKIDRPDKDNFSPLLIAACNGHAETIKTLLAHRANLYHVDKNDKTAIYWAAEEDQLGALQVLLEHRRARELIDTSDRYDNTPLHMAAQKGYIACVKALIDADADMDAKNEEEQTPLHLAAKYGKTNVVKELVKRNKMVINDEDEDSNTALHLAALAGHNKAVMALIDAGADIEARNTTLWTPLDCAAAKGWAKTVKVLLESDAPIDPMDRTKTTPLHLAAGRGHVPVVNLLLQWHASVAQIDTEGDNCLDLAIKNGHKDVAMAIITSKQWKAALSNERMDLSSGIRDTPMRKLIRKMPDVAEKVFNNCTTSEGNSESFNYKITFNYEFLDDMYARWNATPIGDTTSTSESIYDEDNNLLPEASSYTSDSTVLKNNHPMMLMVKNSQEDLLAHPLVTSLLRHKWNSMGRYVYYTNLFIYAVFLTFLTGYVVVTPAPFNYGFNGSDDTGILRYDCEDIRSLEPKVEQHLLARIGKYVIMALAALNILRELFQIYNAKLQYLGWENLIEWVTYISALLMVIDFSECQQETGFRESWQWNLAAVAVFLAWIDLVLFVRKFPRFGIYVVMFTDICYTFASFFPVFFLFIIAFALAFYVLMQNTIEFQTVGWSLLKTSVMMIGEFEYADLFLQNEGHEGNIYLPGITYALFIIFMILMTIIIMNLLVGLAVDDIKAVQEQAELKRLAMQVELALDVESILPQFLRRRFVVKSRFIEPNKYSKNPFTRCFRWDHSFMTSQTIEKALNPDLDEMEKVQENQEKMLSQVNNLRYRMKSMEQNQELLSSMLTALLRHHKVDWEEEDVTQELGSV